MTFGVVTVTISNHSSYTNPNYSVVSKLSDGTVMVAAADVNKSLESDNLKVCPEYWGGFSFTPYYFEFWEGHESRLNKRNVYEIGAEGWGHSILQP